LSLFFVDFLTVDLVERAILYMDGEDQEEKVIRRLEAEVI
jgi:hypothetical protein